MKNKKLAIKKYYTGTNTIAVPEPIQGGEVANQALSMAGQGAALGKLLGPKGMLIGAAVGGLAGGVMGIINKRNRDKEIEKANELNSAYNAAVLNTSGREQTQIEPTLYQKGTDSINTNFASVPNMGIIPDNNVSSKLIEVEKDELVFRKINNEWVLAADLKKAKPHSQGGKLFEAQEGDIIFPAKMREEVLKAYKTNDKPMLNRLRMSLPKDNNTVVPSEFSGAPIEVVPQAKRGRFAIKKYQDGTKKISGDTSWWDNLSEAQKELVKIIYEGKNIPLGYNRLASTIPSGTVEKYRNMMDAQSANPMRQFMGNMKQGTLPVYYEPRYDRSFEQNQAQIQTPQAPVNPKTIKENYPIINREVVRENNYTAPQPPINEQENNRNLGSSFIPAMFSQKSIYPVRDAAASTQGLAKINNYANNYPQPINTNLNFGGGLPIPILPSENVSLSQNINFVEPEIQKNAGNNFLGNMDTSMLAANAISQIPNIYNMVRGFGKSTVEQPINPTLRLQQFVDKYNPARRAALESRTIAMANRGGGSIQNIQQNQRMALAKYAGQMADINRMAANEAAQIDAANINSINQFEQAKAQELRRINENNLRNRAARDQFVNNALTGITNSANQMYQNEQMRIKEQNQMAVSERALQNQADYNAAMFELAGMGRNHATKYMDAYGGFDSSKFTDYTPVPQNVQRKSRLSLSMRRR